MIGSVPAWATDAAPKYQWRVQHKLTNQRHEEGTPLLLRIADHSIQALDGKTVVLDIPAARVLAITYDDDVHRPLREWLITSASGVATGLIRQARAEDTRGDWTGIKAFSGLICAGSSSTFCRYKDENFMATLVSGVVMGGFVAILDKHQEFRSIDLVWVEDGVLRNALFHVSNNDEELSLLDALAAETGKPWVDLTEKRRQLHDEIAKFKLSAQPLVLDRTVLLEGERVPAGEYRLVSVSREKDVQLNFFRGTSVTAESFVAQAIAQRSPRASVADAPTAVPATVRYTPGEPAAGIAEITTSDSTFLLGAPAAAGSIATPPPAVAETAAPAEAAAATAPAPSTAAAGTTPSAPSVLTAPAAEPDLPVLTLTMKNGDTAQVTLVTYRGQRAFRFSVEHIHTNYGMFAKEPKEECAGSLYVMADRMAFDAGLNLHKDRDPFDVARSEIREAKSIPRSSTSWGSIRVVVGKKKYDFMPYFSNTMSPLAHPPGTGLDVGWITGFKQLRNTGAAGRPMLDAFMDVVLDFPGTVAQVESGHYTPKPHQEHKGYEEQAPDNGPTP
jgi:hypothetical protein